VAQKKILFYHPVFLDGGVEKTNLLISEELSKKYEIFFVSNYFSNKFDSDIQKIGIKKIKLKSNRTILSIFEFPRIIKEINPDLIFSLQMHANVTLLILNFLFFFNKLKIISCERLSPQSYNKNFKGKIILFLAKVFYRFSKKIICNSADLAKEIKNFSKSKNVVFIYNPTLKRNFKELSKKIKFKKKPFFKKKRKIIISIGRLDENKNQIMLLRAINHLKEKKNFDIVLIGEGKNKRDLIEYGKKIGINDNLYIYNFQKNPYPYLFNSDLKILTSNFEGLPNVLLEAMALNIPIISTNSPTGPREILLNGKAGYLVKRNDHISLSKKIKFFLENPIAFRKKKLFYKDSLKRFSPEKSLKNYVRIVESII
tara:strand:+ start:2030 stop:3139 length:1110 start_codon:yes stop_codon:yes gene_type:complete